ncbi:hypothetical protein ILUMI_15201 [Ignelater luminosus]|uniref:Uncharacterized protein n=1 Tax=Ignelater luminosus TaxID=2038154 RepID=A0A8K0CTE4_IGNLU|nr:hypothetical protein ILUMI_15201 [Ignelater luminosus]
MRSINTISILTTFGVLMKIIAEKGEKRVGEMTSVEIETNFTMVLAVNAESNLVLSMFVFPRKFYREHFVRDSPADCCRTANSTGGITGSAFLIIAITKSRNAKQHPGKNPLGSRSSLGIFLKKKTPQRRG